MYGQPYPAASEKTLHPLGCAARTGQGQAGGSSMVARTAQRITASRDPAGTGSRNAGSAGNCLAAGADHRAVVQVIVALGEVDVTFDVLQAAD